MSQSVDFPPARRSLFFPVVIATVLLTVIGMSGGIALAWYHNGKDKDNQEQSSDTSSRQPASPGAPQCRPETQQVAPAGGAQGTLRTKLLLRTKSAAVWICADEAGRLFYHANRGGEHAIWIEGKTALFLAGVQPDGQGGFRVTANDGTTFSINAQRLEIVHKDGTLENQSAYP